MTRKRIFVCSPFRGDIEYNTKIAKQLCHEVVKAGHAPFAPHLLYPLFLSEEVDDRTAGIQSGLSFLSTCAAVWVYTVGGITPGMKQEILDAVSQGISVIFDPIEFKPVSEQLMLAPGFEELRGVGAGFVDTERLKQAGVEVV